MKIALITDAWFPQINGVVRTLDSTVQKCRAIGHTLQVISPDLFRTVPCPTYPEIRLALWAGRKCARLLDDFAPDAIHIATEGPLGLAARRYCLRRSFPFTTSYATRFPEYVHARTRIPNGVTYAFLRWFHRPSAALMVSTPRLKDEMASKGFRNLVVWARGVDVSLFAPDPSATLDLPRPVMLYVGRVAVEKNIEAFLSLSLPGSKCIVGDGPQRAYLEKKYPDAHFFGSHKGADLARFYAAADVFVFPSLTDTFGLVMLEALAAGTPVAAFPVPGPIDVITTPDVGILDTDLGRAITSALTLKPEACREFALTYSWDNVANLFLSHLAPRVTAE